MLPGFMLPGWVVIAPAKIMTPESTLHSVKGEILDLVATVERKLALQRNKKMILITKRTWKHFFFSESATWLGSVSLNLHAFSAVTRLYCVLATVE